MKKKEFQQVELNQKELFNNLLSEFQMNGNGSKIEKQVN